VAKQEYYNMGQGSEKLITKIKNKTIAETIEQIVMIKARNY
jgi:hypothetical protein